MFRPNPGCLTFVRSPLIEWINRLIRQRGIEWAQGDSAQAADALEPILDDSQRLFLFGEPYSSGLGVHNVHQNQGDPAEIGIADLAAPDFGDPVPVRKDEIPVFWACGVTSQVAVAAARPEIAVTHSPGSMLVLDLRDEELGETP